MNEKVLIYSILGLLAIGFISILFIVVPWVSHMGLAGWRRLLIDDGLIIGAILLFVFGFYMNTRMH